MQFDQKWREFITLLGGAVVAQRVPWAIDLHERFKEA